MSMTNPFADPDLISLSDLIELIDARRDIDHLKRRDMGSAIRTLGKWFGLPLEMIPASAAFIRDKLQKVHPVLQNVSKRRIQNVRSLVLGAMRTQGLCTNMAHYGAPMSTEWQALWDLLDESTYARTELSRFFRFCSNKDITPAQICDNISAEFLAALEAETLVKAPRTRHQSTCRVWNKMGALHRDAGWPLVRLSVPRYDTKRIYAIEDAMIGPGVLADIDRYVAHLSGNDLFGGPPTPFRPTSLKAIRGHIRRYLSALHHQGADLRQASSLDDLFAPDQVEHAFRWLWERNGNATSKHIGEIAWTIRCYAVKYRQPSDEAEAFFSQLVSRLRVQSTGLSDKNLACIRQFDDPKAVQRFVSLPPLLWNRAYNTRKIGSGAPSKKAALLIQAAVAIEILTFAPMRLKNLRNLHLDRHMSWQSGRLRITIPANEVKNSQALDFNLPQQTSERIARYIEEWRSIYLPKANPYLFPGRNMQPKDMTAVRRQIEKALWDHAGLRLTPHQFRHVAAKVLLDNRPGHYEVVRKLLGHKSMHTTYAHYAGGETQAAVELYADVVADQRRRTAQPERSKTRMSPAKSKVAFMDPLLLIGKGQRR